jgi:prevent-host-death family protein
MLVVEPAPRTVEEVPVRELSRDTSEVLARVRAGGRVVVTNRGVPVAVILEVDEAIGLCGTRVLRRSEAQRRLFGDELADRFSSRKAERLRRELDTRNRQRVERVRRERLG